MAEKTPTPAKVTAESLNPVQFGASGGSDVSKKIKYNVTNLTYPLTTAASEDLQHYVGFFINVRTKSQYKTSNAEVAISGTEENRINAAKAQTGLVAGATAIGAFAGYKLSSAVAANAAKIGPVGKGLVVGAGTGLGALGAGAAMSVFSADSVSRIDTAIMMAVHERPSVTYDVNYKGTDMGSMAGMLAGGSSAIDASLLQSSPEIARQVMLNLADIPATIAQAMGSNFDTKDLAGLATGTAQNPFREQIFQSVDNRTFQFDYKFLPKTQVEVWNVFNIIREFKVHMHPEISKGGFFYIYPSQFNIVYYYKGSQHPYFHRISTCVLQNMSVDYGGQQFTSFDDGMPTEINLRLKFIELEVLTKERIFLGY